jgi:competence protein ComEC
MNRLRQFPLIRILPPIFLGIAASIIWKQGLRLPLVFPGGVFLCLGVIVFFPKAQFPFSLRWLTGLLIFILIALLSYRIAEIRKDYKRIDYVGNARAVQRSYIGEIIEPVIQKQKKTKFIAQITCMKENGKWKKTEGKVVVTIVKNSASQLLCYGDRLLMNTMLAEPEGSLNPGGFDNKRYLELHGIYLQTFVKSRYWQLISHKSRNPFFRIALFWRDKMLMLLRNNGLKGREFAVAGALLLGYVDEVDNDLMHDYSSTGVIHILSVSGMHVGMIFIVLESLFVFLEKRKYSAYLKAFLVIAFIWLYALITGLSPAVMRAAAMLSLIIIGKAMNRHPDMLNTLAASMIFLIIWQPLLLADIGFELSYLAVIGIVLLYKPIHALIVLPNRWLDKIGSIVAVSIAAQIGTLPLCLYYFHQFPNYFMLTNIVVIPLSNLIVYTGIVALALGGIPSISFYIGKVLSFLVCFLNTFIHWMGVLPFSVTRGIVITFPESLLIYATMIVLSAFILQKKTVWLFVSISLMILLSGSFLQRRYQQMSMNTFTVYDVKGNGLFDFTTGGRSILVGSLSSMKDPFFHETLLKSRWNEKVTGLFEFQYPLPSAKKAFQYGKFFYKNGSFISFWRKKIAIITKRMPETGIRKLNVDYLIISGNPKSDLKDILRNINPSIVILDSSNPLWKVKEWMKEAHNLHVQCHSVSISGAFRDVF